MISYHTIEPENVGAGLIVCCGAAFLTSPSQVLLADPA
jgi:hypothetical protein